jgi:hypothetical protein
MLFEFKVSCKFLEETKTINHKFYCLIIHNNKQPTILSLQGEEPRLILVIDGTALSASFLNAALLQNI